MRATPAESRPVTAVVLAISARDANLIAVSLPDTELIYSSTVGGFAAMLYRATIGIAYLRKPASAELSLLRALVSEGSAEAMKSARWLGLVVRPAMFLSSSGRLGVRSTAFWNIESAA